MIAAVHPGGGLRRWRERALFLVAVASLVPALTLPLHAQTFPLTWYSSSDGLAHNAVKAMVQDSVGYLWIGTRNGVSRFDGHEFRNINTAESGLANRAVMSMVLDRTGTGVWCNVQDEGIYHIDSSLHVTQLSRMTNGWIRPVLRVRDVIRTDDDALWFTTLAGVTTVNPRTGWRDFTMPASQPPARWYTWIAWNRNEHEVWAKCDPWRVLAVTIDGSAVRCINLTPGAGRDRRDTEYTILSMVANPVSGGVWLITSTGLIMAGDSAGSLRRVPMSRLGGYVYFRPTTDRDGNLWYVHQSETGESYEYRKAAWRDGSLLVSTGGNSDFRRMLPFGTVFEDRDGSLWIGADGLAHLQSMGIVNHELAWEGMPTVPRNLLVLPDGTRVMATWGGVYTLPADPFAAPVFLSRRMGSPGLPMSQLMTTADGDVIWTQLHTGSFILRSGRVRLDRRDGRHTLGGGIHPPLDIMAVTTSGTMMYASLTDPGVVHKIRRCGGHAAIPLPLPGAGEQLAYERICAPRHYCHGWNGAFFVSDSALYEVPDSGAVRRLGAEQGYAPDLQPCIAEDSSGSIWIGRQFARNDICLQRFDGSGFQSYTSSQVGLPYSSVSALVAHPNRRELLVGTFYGLLFIDLTTMKVTRHLTQEDGLISNVVNAMTVDPDGSIWILTEGGLSRYMGMDRSTSPPAPTVIAQFLVDDQAVDVPGNGGTVMLPSIPERLEMSFATLSYGSKHEYQTYLQGYDSDWSPPTRSHRVHYTNLPAGTYVFHVRPARQHGVTGPTATLVFTIPIPFHRSTWFITLCMLAVVGTLYMIFHIRRRARQRVTSLRAAIALDIHDEIGSTLTSISFLSAMAEREVPETHPQALAHIRKIGETSRQVIEMVSDIIWSLRPENDRTVNFQQRLTDFTAEMAEATGVRIALEFERDLSALPMRMDYRRNMFLIAKEAITNAIRHAQCTEIVVRMRSEGRHLEFCIIDNGVGLRHATRSQTRGSGSGLASMTRRAAEIGGELVVQEQETGGTAVIIRCLLQDFA